MGWLEHARYEREFVAEADRLGGVVSGLEPARAVPTCPEWTVRDLVTHVGRGHRWATAIVAQRLVGPPEFPAVEAPEESGEWSGWIAAGAQGLVDAIREAGAERVVWTWQRDRTAGFWLRRMLHDLLVHRFDAELTAGELGDVAPDLAADGVADSLETAATFSQYKNGKTTFVRLAGEGERLRFAATDHAGVWVVERTPDGVTWVAGDDGAAAGVSVRAPARELLLLLNRRVDADADGFEVTGDRALLAHWVEHTRF